MKYTKLLLLTAEKMGSVPYSCHQCNFHCVKYFEGVINVPLKMEGFFFIISGLKHLDGM